jgi:hypothetical protein
MAPIEKEKDEPPPKAQRVCDSKEKHYADCCCDEDPKVFGDFHVRGDKHHIAARVRASTHSHHAHVHLSYPIEHLGAPRSFVMAGSLISQAGS